MKKRAVSTLLLALLLLGGVLYWRHLESFVIINVSIDSDELPLEVALYPYSHDDEGRGAKKNILTHGEQKVKKGVYELISTASDDFAESAQTANIESDGQKFSVKPDYSDKKLSILLEQEKAAITQEVLGKYPLVASAFIIAPGNLYGRGDWYATKLISTSRDDGSNDSLRAVLKKDGPVWRLVTIPPDIFISHVTYPEIPRHILVDLNQ